MPPAVTLATLRRAKQVVYSPLLTAAVTFVQPTELHRRIEPRGNALVGGTSVRAAFAGWRMLAATIRSRFSEMTAAKA